MKKLLSLFLAAVMLLTALSAIAPALKASAEDVKIFTLYAYKSDGSFSEITDFNGAEGLTASFDNNELVTIGGVQYRSLNLMITPKFNENYVALYTETTNGVITTVYVNGTVNLSARKMTRDGDTFYAALASNNPIVVYPMSDDNLLSLAMTPRNTLDARVALIRVPTGKFVDVRSLENRRMRLKTYLDLRYLESDGGFTVSPVDAYLHLRSASYHYKSNASNTSLSRQPLKTESLTCVYLYGSAVMYTEFNGGSDTEGCNTYKAVYAKAPFTGAIYDSLYHGLGGTRYTDEIEADCEVAYAINGPLYSGAVMSRAAQDGNAAAGLTPLTAEDLKTAFTERLPLKVGDPFKTYFAGGRKFVATVNWKDADGNALPADAVVEGGKTYVASVTVCPGVDIDNWTFYTMRSNFCGNELAPDDVYYVEWTDAPDPYISAIDLYYLPIFEGAPAIVEQPKAQTLVHTGGGSVKPEKLTFTAGYINGYIQWYGVDSLGHAQKLTESADFKGVNKATLEVRSEAVRDYQAIYFVVSARGYDSLTSERAAINHVYEIVSVTVNHLTAPEAGVPLDTDFSVSTDPSWSGTVLSWSVQYLDAASNAVKTSVVKGDKIKVNVAVTLNEKYRFQDYTLGRWEGNGGAFVQAALSGEKRTAIFSFPYTVVSDKEIGAVPLGLNFPAVDQPMPELSDFKLPTDANYWVSSLETRPAVFNGNYDQRVKPDTAYTVIFRVTAAGDYKFTPDTVFTLNGETLEATLTNGNTVANLSYTFPAQSVVVLAVSRLTVTDLDLPQAGVEPDKTYGVESDEFTPSAYHVIKYTETGTGKELTSFKPGDKVTVTVRVVIIEYGRVFNPETTATWGELTAFPELVDEDPREANFSFEYTVPGGLTGDVDGNGAIEPADARLALRISLGLMKDGEVDMTPDMVARADADGKDGVQPADARLILRKSLGLVDPEWVG